MVRGRYYLGLERQVLPKGKRLIANTVKFGAQAYLITKLLFFIMPRNPTHHQALT